MWRGRTVAALLAAGLQASPALGAPQTADDLRGLARNPVADVIRVPFEVDVGIDAGPYHRTPSDLQIFPLLPFQVSGNWLLIPRIVTTPVAYAPDVAQSRGGSTGVGDTVATFFLAPARTGRLAWGLGPSLLIPTATNANTGSGKWGLGPSVAGLAAPEWGSISIIVQNVWSLPGHVDRAPVNQMQVQPSLSYNLPRNWYLCTNPAIGADWTQPAGDRWLVPLGGGVGRTANVGRQAVDWNIALYSNVVGPAHQPFPKWLLSLQGSLLYPRTRT